VLAPGVNMPRSRSGQCPRPRLSVYNGDVMKAMAVYTPAPIETDPLRAIELPEPEPGLREILVRIKTCGVCRTDLHVAEGDLPPRHPRIVPGHEIVGAVVRCGP